MRVVILTQYYPPEMGAAQARLSELAAHCVERGHAVWVLTGMPSYPQGRLYAGYGGLFRRERQGGVTIIRTCVLPTQSVKLIPRLASYIWFTLAALITGTIMLPRADVLITESPPLFLGITGYVLSRIKHSRWVFNVSDLWPGSAVQLGVLHAGWALRAAYWLEALCYRNAQLVSGQSREILEDIHRRFPGTRVYHLSNGVDTSLFAPRLRCPEIWSELIGCRPEIVVVYAGLHGIAQGLDQVLRAAARLDIPGLHFVLVGDGPLKEALVRQAASLRLTRLHFLDPLPRAEMPVVLASADIGIVPLRGALYGAVPSKLYEVMAAHLPVVLVAQGEAARIVRDARAGMVVPPGDVEALAAAVRRFSEDPSLRSEAGAAGRQAAEERYDRQRIWREFVDFLEREIAEAVGGSGQIIGRVPMSAR